MSEKIKVSGKKAILIDEIVELNTKVKKMSEEISDKKAQLEKVHKIGDKKATYITKKGGILEINSRKSYLPISPKDVLKKLKAKRLGKKFLDCVSVVLKPTQKYLDEDEIAEIRKEGDPTFTWSFK